MSVEAMDHVRRAIDEFSKGEFESAQRHCYSALSETVAQPYALQLLGVIALRSGRTDEAIDHLQSAISCTRNEAEFFNSLGLAYLQKQDTLRAIQAFEQAIQLKPSMAEAHYNLGMTYQSIHDYEKAEQAYSHACIASSDALDCLTARIHVRQHLCDWEQLEDDARQVVEGLHEGRWNPDRDEIPPFSFLSLPIATAPEDQLRVAKSWSAKFSTSPLALSFGGGGSSDAGTDRTSPKIRIGYLSADFGDHPVGWLIPELLEGHDRTQVEVFGYSTRESDNSDMAARIRRACDTFIELSSLSWREAAERIRNDRIDILIDLHGHTQGAKMEILAHRPAPIQASYLGYPGTTGADFIDYLFVDGTIVPREQAAAFTEKLVQLPHCFMVQDGQAEIARHKRSRVELGLPNEAVVLCAFGSYFKLTPSVFDRWMRVMTRVPTSILWLRDGPKPAMDRLRRFAQRAGVDPERLIFAGRLPRPEHLARQAAADLFLDTFPYNQHSTAADALRVGLPIVTLMGRTFASRVAGSLLRELGMDELIAENLLDYEAMLIELATSTEHRNELRSKLGNALVRTRLYDGRRFAKSMEQAFTAMMQLHRDGKPTSTISLVQPTADG